ncbi:copper chaperone PCu(A)C [Paraburkholderia sp. C35]|uniref:copper chaperone PCu(A)C n=1 Tax=Paraburkholderia sp. C35 TaxID=2126993 RepID=UPI000D69C1A9|nr:copper chaperone PCu(A)C [Paraburkholderia sp. C35]
MKRTLPILALFALCAPMLNAHAASSPSVMVSDCWVRSMPGDVPSGAYFTAMNMSDKAIDLTSVDTDAFGMAMLHQTQSSGSTSKMVMVDKATVPAHGKLAFAPGGYHVMLEQRKAPLKIGSTLPLTFSFSDGEKLTAQCAIKPAGATSR